jgi:WD40 repeat protein
MTKLRCLSLVVGFAVVAAGILLPLAAALADDKSDLTSLAVSADGKLAATGGRDGVVRVWDLKKNQLVQAITVGHPVLALALAPDGKLFAAGCDDTAGVKLYKWRHDSFTFQRTLPEKWTVLSLAISTDGKTLAIGREGSGTIHVHDLAAEKLLGVLWEPSNLTSALAFSPDGRSLASAGNTFIRWDVRPETLRLTRPDQEKRDREELERAAKPALIWREKANPEYSSDIAFSPDGQRLAGVSGVGRLFTGGESLEVRDAKTGKLEKALRSKGMTCITFAPGANRVVTGSDMGRITVWDLDAGKPVQEWDGHTKAVRVVAVIPGSTDLATVGADREFRIWDPATGKRKQRFSHR